MTEKLYVLGHPVAHSKSPAMHNAAYKALGLHWEYGFADCATELDARVFLNAQGWRACNVTMPYKPLALEFATHASDAARLARGANVLVKWAGRVHADNTDGIGCVAYLRREGARFEGARVAVCGTGPTSLSIMHAVACAGARSVSLHGRDEAKARRVLADYLARASELESASASASAAAPASECESPDVFERESTAAHESAVAPEREGATELGRESASAPDLFAAHTYEGEGLAALADADIIIDATPLGMKPGDPAPFDTGVLGAGQIVFDVVYGHGETALLAAARAAGCAAYDGAGMLVAQAVETVRDLAEITGCFAIPAHLDLFTLMAEAAKL